MIEEEMTEEEMNLTKFKFYINFDIKLFFIIKLVFFIYEIIFYKITIIFIKSVIMNKIENTFPFLSFIQIIQTPITA